MEIQPNPNRAGASGAGHLPEPANSSGQSLASIIRAAQPVDLRGLAAELLDVAPRAGNMPGDGISNGNGMPAIPAPAGRFSTADMVDLLRSLQTKTQDTQLKSVKENLETNRIEQAKNNERQQAKIEEWIEKSRQAQKSGIFGKIFGWIGAIVAVIAAAVLSVAAIASGGAAAPLAIAAVVASISAVNMLTTQISQEAGGGPVGLFGVLSDMVGKLLTAFGVDEKTAGQIGKALAGAALIYTGLVLADPSCIGEMAGSIAQLAGASDEVAGYISMALGMVATVAVGILMTVLTGGGAAAGVAARVASLVSTAVQAAGQVASGAESIDRAVKEKAADAAIAAKKELEALMVKLQAGMEQDREKLKEILMAMDESMRLVSKMLSDAGDSMAQITQNIGKRAMV